MSQSMPSRLRHLIMRSDAVALLGRITSLVASRLGGSVLTLLYTILMARVTAPADFGIAMAGLSWAVLISIALSLNVEAGSIRYLVEYVAAGRAKAAAGFLKFNLYVTACLTALLVALTVFLVVVGLWQISDTLGRVFLLSVATAPALALARVYGRHATALDAVLLGSLPRMLVQPTIFCVVLLAIDASGAQVEADILMAVFFASAVLTALLQFALLRRTFLAVGQHVGDFGARRAWVATGLSMVPLLILRENLKHLLISGSGFVLAAEELGEFALAISLLGPILFAVRAVDISVSPRLSKAIATGRGRHIAKYLGGSAILKVLGALAGLALVLLLDQVILAVVGYEYVEAARLLPILMLLPLSEALFGPTHVVLNITGRRMSVFAGSLAGIFAIVAATAIGGWLHSGTGVAWAASVAYAVHQVSLWLLCRRTTGIETSALGIRLFLDRGSKRKSTGS